MQKIKSQRLQNQHIEYSQMQNPVELLSSLGAIQGQDYQGAKWSLGLRLANATDEQIEQAIADNKIVRTWLMRGTLFLTAASDVRWILDIVAERLLANSQRRYRELGLDEATFVASDAILFEALKDAKQLRRRELYAILEEHNISTRGQRGVHMIQHASLLGLIVHGTVFGNDPNFMCLDDAVPQCEPMPRDVALAELARRFFRSRGTATVQDFAWWSGMLMPDVRAGFEAIQAELVEEIYEGVTYWHFANSSMIESPASPSVYMLPGFDEYLLGYQNRDIVLETQHAFKVCPGANGVFFPTVVIDGQMRGIWKRIFKKNVVEMNITPFTDFTALEKDAIVVESERFGAYVEKSVSINFS